jgi:hypothetical protein
MEGEVQKLKENLRLLKSKEFHLVDWENLLEEIEGITSGRTSKNIQERTEGHF